MKVVIQDESPLVTLAYESLEQGKVYTNVSDDEDDDLYLFTDLGQLIQVRTGIAFDETDPWTQVDRFLEVDVTLVVNK